MAAQEDGATSIALAFYYQGCFALVTILAEKDDLARIAVETEDDVVLEAATLKRLVQLKHKVRPLSLRSDDLWRAMANWLNHLADQNTIFQFVTTAGLVEDAALRALVADADRDVSLAHVREAFAEESRRVLAEIEVGKGSHNRFAKRFAGCERFLALSPKEQVAFLSRVQVAPNTFGAHETEGKVIDLLSTIPSRIRKQVANRLIEWWDRQVALAFMGKRERFLTKFEVLDQLALIVSDHFDDSLPDDYAGTEPPNLLDDTPILVKQIKLAELENFWILRAKQARWRARAQRQRWMSEGFASFDRLRKFDNMLVEEWEYRFQVHANLCNGEQSREPAAGAAVFKWSFLDAPREVPAIHRDWTSPYLVRGTYQDLSNDMKVGWHPRYEELVGREDDDTG
jgi:hypothetical protein